MADCELWAGGVSGARRYGWSAKDRDYAHRVAYRAAYGEIPEGAEIHHTCEVKLCVNPAHLIAVSRAEHNRIHPNQHVGKKHCYRGHEFTPENTYFRADRPNVRGCRECHRIVNRETMRRYREKLRAA